MRLYTRDEFLKLPKNIIYSRVSEGPTKEWELMKGLYCKQSTYEDNHNDWFEQDLIACHSCEEQFTGDPDALRCEINKRDTFQYFETDIYLLERDGMFDYDDVFVVWDKKDVTKLRDYLNDVINDE